MAYLLTLAPSAANVSGTGSGCLPQKDTCRRPAGAPGRRESACARSWSCEGGHRLRRSVRKGALRPGKAGATYPGSRADNVLRGRLGFGRQHLPTRVGRGRPRRVQCCKRLDHLAWCRRLAGGHPVAEEHSSAVGINGAAGPRTSPGPSRGSGTPLPPGRLSHSRPRAKSRVADHVTGQGKTAPIQQPGRERLARGGSQPPGVRALRARGIAGYGGPAVPEPAEKARPYFRASRDDHLPPTAGWRTLGGDRCAADSASEMLGRLALPLVALRPWR